MKTEIKPFISNFFELMHTESSKLQEYDERAQICFRSIEDLKNGTSTASAPTNDADSDSAEAIAEF